MTGCNCPKDGLSFGRRRGLTQQKQASYWEKARLFEASELACLFTDHRSLRLVLLNAWEGTMVSDEDPLSSVAATLARRGLPTVVAMQDQSVGFAGISSGQHFVDF